MRTTFIALFLAVIGACATTPGGPPVAQVYLSAQGDLWAYADDQAQAAVGTGIAAAEARMYGLTIVPAFPTTWQDAVAWFRHAEEGERTQGIGDPWPWWMASRLRIGEQQTLEQRFGVTITFEPPPVYPGPEDTVPPPTP